MAIRQKSGSVRVENGLACDEGRMLKRAATRFGVDHDADLSPGTPARNRPPAMPNFHIDPAFS